MWSYNISIHRKTSFFRPVLFLLIDSSCFKQFLCLHSCSKFEELPRNPSERRGHSRPPQGPPGLPLRPSTSRRRTDSLVSSHPRLSHEVRGPLEGTPSLQGKRGRSTPCRSSCTLGWGSWSTPSQVEMFPLSFCWRGTQFSSWCPSQTGPSCFRMQSEAGFVGNIPQ